MVALGGGAGLGVVADHRNRAAARLRILKCKLNRCVAVSLGGLHLGDDARSGFNHGDGDIAPVFGEVARHADLASKYCRGHCADFQSSGGYALILTKTPAGTTSRLRASTVRA